MVENKEPSNNNVNVCTSWIHTWHDLLHTHC